MSPRKLIAELKRDGFSLLPEFLNKAQLDHLLSSVRPHAELADPRYGTSKDKRITLAMFQTRASRRVMRDIVFDEELLSILKELYQKPFVEHTKILLKAPNGSDTPWHQDGMFWKDFDPDNSMISLWIALESVNRDNGCLELLKTTRLVKELLPHEVVRDGKELEIPANILSERFADSEKLAIELCAGDALIFDANNIHRAYPNKTSAPRIGLKIVFQDGAKRVNSAPRHISSIEMTGLPGVVNRVFPCAITSLSLQRST